jgi:hypothetical protein
VIAAHLTPTVGPPGQNFSIEKLGWGFLEAVKPPPPRKRVAASVAVAA